MMAAKPKGKSHFAILILSMSFLKFFATVEGGSKRRRRERVGAVEIGGAQ
jgi:hypothetical protein